MSILRTSCRSAVLVSDLEADRLDGGDMSPFSSFSDISLAGGSDTVIAIGQVHKASDNCDRTMGLATQYEEKNDGNRCCSDNDTGKQVVKLSLRKCYCIWADISIA